MGDIIQMKERLYFSAELNQFMVLHTAWDDTLIRIADNTTLWEYVGEI